MRDIARPDLSYAMMMGGIPARRAFLTIGEAMREERGNGAATARRLGVPLRTYRRWLSKYPQLRRLQHEAAKLRPMAVTRGTVAPRDVTRKRYDTGGTLGLGPLVSEPSDIEPETG